MTTHRERIQACLKAEITDRTPIALWRHFPVDDQNPETLAAATLEYQNAYDFDIVKVTPSSSFAVKDWGVNDEWMGDAEGSRRYTKRIIENLRIGNSQRSTQPPRIWRHGWSASV